ncbi:MAG: DUF1328 domain-containing protein [Candidatus Devosia euplotis]|nr:DUF1328 domain-containing protein [Candidatus Devosia euplotis]
MIALVSSALGFFGLAAGAAFLAKIVFGIILIGIVVLLAPVFLGLAALS